METAEGRGKSPLAGDGPGSAGRITAEGIDQLPLGLNQFSMMAGLVPAIALPIERGVPRDNRGHDEP
jgi:hypothetical protein